MPEEKKDQVEEKETEGSEKEETSGGKESEGEEESGGEEKKETKEDSEDEESLEEEKEIEAALQLYKALKGPEGRNIVKQLAVQAKLIAEEEGISPKEAKKAVVDVLKEELGEEYSFLAERLGKGLDKIIQTEIGEVKRQLSATQRAAKEHEADAALGKFYSDYPESKKLESKMLRKMQSMPYGSGDVYEYLEDIYVLSGGTRKSGASSVEKTIKRMKENAKDANLASSDVDEARVKRGPQRPTIQEAVEAAAKGIKFAD